MLLDGITIEDIARNRLLRHRLYELLTDSDLGVASVLRIYWDCADGSMKYEDALKTMVCVMGREKAALLEQLATAQKRAIEAEKQLQGMFTTVIR